MSQVVIKKAKTIAEYAIRKWLIEEGFVMECFDFHMQGNQGILTDQTGESMTLEYISESKSVIVKEESEK